MLIYNMLFLIDSTDTLSTPNEVQVDNANIPSKRLRIPNPKYFTLISCVINSSCESSSTTSKTAQQGAYSLYRLLLALWCDHVIY
jgi:hypothetical protein